MTTALHERVFRPEVFFLGRTEGGGIVRDMFGRPMRRCRVTTEGAYGPAYGAIHFDETFAYDDGEVDVWRWAMTPTRDGRYVAAEAMIGTGIEGGMQGEDYVLNFRRPVKNAPRALAPSFRTRLTLLEPSVALKHVRVSLFGVPLGVLTAVHRRVGGS